MPASQHNRQHATGPSLAPKSGKRKKQARASLSAKRDDGASGSIPFHRRVDRTHPPSKKIDAVANPPEHEGNASLRTPDKKRPSAPGSGTTPKLKKKKTKKHKSEDVQAPSVDHGTTPKDILRLQQHDRDSFDRQLSIDDDTFAICRTNVPESADKLLDISTGPATNNISAEDTTSSKDTAIVTSASSTATPTKKTSSQSLKFLLSDFDSISTFGLLPKLTVEVHAQGGHVVSSKGYSFLQMNVLDRHSKQRRLVGLGKDACTLLAPLDCGMTVLLTNLKTTRARSGGQLEFHVTDSNVKKVTVAKLAEVKRQTVYTSLDEVLNNVLRKNDAGVIIQVKLTAWQLLQDGPVMQILCFDDQHSILLVLTGPSRDRMTSILEQHTDKVLSDAERAEEQASLDASSPRLHAPGSNRPRNLNLGHLISFKNVAVSHVGMHHLRTTALTIIDVCTSDPPCPKQPIATIADRTSFPMTTAAMYIPLSAVNAAPLLEVYNSINDKHGLDFFIVHASLASVNVGKTRSGDVSIGFKLEDSTQTMWANCYGDKISRFLRLDVGQFNSMAHKGSLRTHIEQLFEGTLTLIHSTSAISIAFLACPNAYPFCLSPAYRCPSGSHSGDKN